MHHNSELTKSVLLVVGKDGKREWFFLMSVLKCVSPESVHGADRELYEWMCGGTCCRWRHVGGEGCEDVL